MDPLDSLAREHFLLDLLWITPIVVGTIAVAYAALTLKRKDPLLTVLTCFILAVAVIGSGVFGTWRGGLQLSVILGVAGDISVEMLYAGWRRSWLPMVYASVATAGLVMIALLARYRLARPRNEGAA